MSNRFKFKKSSNNIWYIIDIDREDLFIELDLLDPILLADEFDDCQVNNIESFTFEYPIELNYE